MLKNLPSTGWKWQLVDNSKEQWRAIFIEKMEESQELEAKQLFKAKTRKGCEEISKLVQSKACPFWKLEYLAKATTPFEFDAIAAVQNENLLYYVFRPSQQWLRDVLLEIVVDAKADKLEIGRLAVLSKADYIWEAKLLKQIMFDKEELFDEKAELILACNGRLQGEMVLETKSWKISYLRNVINLKHGNFKAMLEDIEPWKCDLLSRAGSPLEVDIIKAESSQIKAEAMIDNINVLNNWKRTLIDQCPEDAEWKLKHIFDCQEKWKGQAIVECKEQHEWKIPLLSRETDATICKLIINSCQHVWQAQILRQSYTYKPFLGELIPKLDNEEEGWLIANAEFEWQAKHAFEAVKKSWTKAIILTKSNY